MVVGSNHFRINHLRYLTRRLDGFRVICYIIHMRFNTNTRRVTGINNVSQLEFIMDVAKGAGCNVQVVNHSTEMIVNGDINRFLEEWERATQ